MNPIISPGNLTGLFGWGILPKKLKYLKWLLGKQLKNHRILKIRENCNLSINQPAHKDL